MNIFRANKINQEQFRRSVKQRRREFLASIISILLMFLCVILIPLKSCAYENKHLDRSLLFNSNQFHTNTLNGLKRIESDLVRAQVFTFATAQEDYTIQNNRDSALSVAFWFCPENIDLHTGTLFGEVDHYYFRYLSNHTLQFNLYKRKDYNTKAFVVEKTWHHVGFSLSTQGELCIYFDGAKVLHDSIPFDWWKKKSKFIIGNDLYNQKAEGKLDDLSVYNRVLNQKEFANLYEQTIMLPELDNRLQLYLPLNKENKAILENGATVQKNKILYVKDSIDGFSAYFSGPNSFMKINNFETTNQQTISMWIKPVGKKGPLALIGNNDFSFRYWPHNGSLFYNVPMVFGLQSKPTSYNDRKWKHVVVALNYDHVIDYYINGRKFDVKHIGKRTGADRTVFIGKSIWGNYFKGNIKEVAIWNRKLQESEVFEVYQGKLRVIAKERQEAKIRLTIYCSISLMILLAFVLFVFFQFKKNKQISVRNFQKYENKRKNKIQLFEPFQAFDKNGEEKTKQFTPILIRMFTLILLYPKFYGRAIDSTSLSNLLWEGDSAEKQKNNRSTNIHRLRQLLTHFLGISLLYEQRGWRIELSELITIDLLHFDHYFSLENKALAQLNFRFTKQLYDDSIYELRIRYQDTVLEKLQEECELSKMEKNWERIVICSNFWLTLDSLSDEALKKQVEALYRMNKRLLALQSYKKFSKHYKQMLNEEYPIDFDQLFVHFRSS